MQKWQFYFKLLGVGEYQIDYNNNLWISLLIFDFFFLFICFFFLLLPLSIINEILYKRKQQQQQRSKNNRRFKHLARVLSVIQIIVEITFAFFAGCLLIVVCMGEYLTYYAGMPLLWLFWAICFVHINRDRDMLRRAEGAVPQGQAMSPSFRNHLVDEDEEEEEGSSAVPLQSVGEQELQRKHMPVPITQKKIPYLSNVLLGLKRRWFVGLIWVLVSAVGCTLVGLSTCRFCVAVFPVEPSTAFTRLVFRQGAVCEWDRICFSYFTVPEDMSTSLIVNYNIYSYEPENRESFVLFSTSPLAEDAEIAQQQAGITKINSTCFRVTTIVEQERYQCWADMTNLTPNTTYYVQTYYKSQVSKSLRPYREVLKVRTLPGADEPVKFVAGGDMQLIMSEVGERLSTYAASEEPLFAVVGGDLAYENGYYHCYRRLDSFMTQWQRLMKTPSGYAIPFLTCIGNHEASGFRQSRSTNSFYIKYFPHELNLQGVDPQNRTLYHFHQFSSHTGLVALDSAVHTEVKDQVPYLEYALSDRSSSLRNKLALYHLSVYPPRKDENADIVAELKQYWEPVFDRYNLTLGFENHFHSFKQTHFIRNGVVVTDEEQASGVKHGTVYVGDGCWGQIPGDGTSNDPLYFKKFARLPNVLVVEAAQDSLSVKAVSYSANTKEYTTLTEFKV